MLHRRRVLAGLVLGVATLSSPATAGDAPHPGAAGIGDPYYPLDGNGGIEVHSYDVRLDYSFGRRRVAGVARLEVRADEHLSSFNLDLLLPVDDVRLDGEPVDWDKPDPHELRITPDQALTPGQVVEVKVRYHGRPGRTSYLGESNWLADDREVVAMNQPHMAPWWFPSNDHPRDRALVDLRVTVPRGHQVVANGHLVDRRVHGRKVTVRWVADEPMAPYLAFFAAGRFRVRSGTTEAGLPWYVAVSKQLPDATERWALRLLRRTPAVVAGLEADLGPYPFSTTGGVMTALDPHFALENQTRPTYDASSLSHSTIVHEIAHQWLGDAVTVAQWSDIWLNEGPATFFQKRWAEQHGGQSAAAWLDEQYDDRGAGDPFWDQVIGDPGPAIDELFAPPVYVRGAMTVQALRNRIGEDDFWTLMRTWVADRSGGSASTADFQALAEETSGADLDGFFDAWLHTGEKPADTPANGLG